MKISQDWYQWKTTRINPKLDKENKLKNNVIKRIKNIYIYILEFTNELSYSFREIFL